MPPLLFAPSLSLLGRVPSLRARTSTTSPSVRTGRSSHHHPRRTRPAHPPTLCQPPPPPPSSPPPPPPSSPRPDNATGHAPRPAILDMPLLAVPMTAGGDVLFPGGSQLVSLAAPQADRMLRHVAGREPPEFAYLPVNAWGDPGEVGTLAVVDDLQLRGGTSSSSSSSSSGSSSSGGGGGGGGGGEDGGGDASLLCSGVTRFRVVHLASDMSSARVELFHDEPPVPQERGELERLEARLVDTMTQIVRLSIKISGAGDEKRQRALAETLKRVEAFCGVDDGGEGRKLVQRWILDLKAERRRELLGFIVIDLVSISFMDRRSLMLSTNTANRLAEALKCLEPFVKELAAKGAIISALGSRHPDEEDDGRDTSRSP